MIKTDRAEGGPVPVGREASVVTVDRIVGDYLRFLETDEGRKHSTLLRYRTVYATWLAPAVGGQPAETVPAGRIERALNEMRRAGQSASSIHQAFTVLSGAYRWATGNDRIGRSPMGGVVKPHPLAPRKSEPCAGDDGWAVIAAAFEYDFEFGVACRLGAVTGMRRGELAGLQWKHVDVNADLVIVAVTVNDAGGRVTIDDRTQSPRWRAVDIDARTAALLRELRDRMDERARLCGVRVGADAFVFSHTPDGSTPPAPNYLTRRMRELNHRRGKTGADLDATLHALYRATRAIEPTELPVSGHR